MGIGRKWRPIPFGAQNHFASSHVVSYGSHKPSLCVQFHKRASIVPNGASATRWRLCGLPDAGAFRSMRAHRGAFELPPPCVPLWVSLYQPRGTPTMATTSKSAKRAAVRRPTTKPARKPAAKTTKEQANDRPARAPLTTGAATDARADAATHARCARVFRPYGAHGAGAVQSFST